MYLLAEYMSATDDYVQYRGTDQVKYDELRKIRADLGKKVIDAMVKEGDKL